MLENIRQRFRYHNQLAGKLLKLFIPITITVYLLRGFGFLSFIPGGIILLLVMLTLIASIIYGLEKTGGI